MKLNYSFLIKFDKLWCGHHQLPASLLLQISGDTNSSAILASHRFYLSLFLFIELIGYFMITLGLYSTQPIWIFLCGVIFKIGGELLSSFNQNKSGTFLTLALQQYLKGLSTHLLEIRSFLADRGCTENEINSLSSLPKDVYQTELQSYQRTRILNIGAPLFCGLALLFNGEIITSLAVIILGLLSFPIGEKFFKENTFRRESQLRIGLATKHLRYIEQIYKEHIWLATKVNFLSQLPLLLFMFRFIWNGSGQLLSSFFGLTQGLIGLTGSLAFQKARAASINTSETATHLINALSSPYLIITPQRWKEHCSSSQKKETSISIQKHDDGILLDNFSPIIPFDDKGIFSISTFIPFGSISLLRASSGRGKTTLLTALTHLIEHTGDMIYLSKGQTINVHDLSREDLEKRIFFFREENVEKSARLVDLFKNSTLKENVSFLTRAKEQFDPMLVDLAWKASDNLLEQEIKNLKNQRRSVFPDLMLDFLKDLRKRQLGQVERLLQESAGNLRGLQIYPERIFSTLSSGEKQRLITLLALESCRFHPETRFVILDEPFAHLDKENIDEQFRVIEEMQKRYSPSLLIISHHLIDEIKDRLSPVQQLLLP